MCEAGASIRDIWLSKPWHQKMGVFADDTVDQAAEVVEEDGARAVVNSIERGALN